MDKSLIGHTVLAIAATGLAFAAWTKPVHSENDPSVTVVDGSVERLTEVDWDEENFTVTIKRNGGLATVSTANKKSPDEKRQVVDFPLSKKGDETLAKLAPFNASRSLGKPDEARTKELGLDAPKTSLTLKYGDKQTKLDVGNSTFGSGNFFVRAPSGEVYLVPSAALTPLKGGGSQLVERTLFNQPRNAVDRIVLTVGDKKRTLVSNSANSAFTDGPENTVEKAQGWADALLRMRVTNRAESLPTEAPAMEAVVRFNDRSERFVKIWPAGAENAVVASTQFPQGALISKSAADGLLKDLPAIIEDQRNVTAP